MQVCAVMCKYNDELSIHQTQIELNAQGMNFTIRTSPVMGGAEAEQVHRPCLSGQASNIMSLNYDKVFLRHTIPVLLFLGTYIFKVFTAAWVALSSVAWT